MRKGEGAGGGCVSVCVDVRFLLLPSIWNPEVL